jgi:hypothetical protein
LAGDVVANLVDGTLTLEGDDLANKIVITSGAEAGAFVVTGLDGTTVHLEGEAGASVLNVSGVRNIKVELGGEADLAAVVGANVRGNLSIDSGAGNDRVLVGTGGDAAELVGQLPADLSVEIRGKLRIDGAAGDDEIAVDDSVLSRLNIEAGLDNDVVSLGSDAALEAGQDARVQVRGGVHVNLGAGNDELTADQVNSRHVLLVRAGTGDNSIDLSRTNTGVLGVHADGGIDTVTLAEIDAHILGLHAGDGSDVVDIHDSVFSKLGVSLGEGDDSLAVANVEARLGLMLGGGGEDTLDLSGVNNIVHEIIHGFEIPPDINTPPFRRLVGRLLGRLR